MGVYLYPSGTETELKNAYIGRVYEYEYDFRGKTISQIVSDWWATAQWTPQITSNWYASTSSSRARSIFTLPSLSTAKKITFYTNIIFTSSTGAADCIRLSTTSLTNMTWYYMDNAWGVQAQIGWSIISQTGISWAWAYKMTVELDFQNSTYKYTLTWHSDITGTLTSEQISNIKSCTVAEVMSDGNTWAVTDFHIIVEY